jgi:hypothetical protein
MMRGGVWGAVRHNGVLIKYIDRRPQGYDFLYQKVAAPICQGDGEKI